MTQQKRSGALLQIAEEAINIDDEKLSPTLLMTRDSLMNASGPWMRKMTLFPHGLSLVSRPSLTLSSFGRFCSDTRSFSSVSSVLTASSSATFLPMIDAPWLNSDGPGYR